MTINCTDIDNLLLEGDEFSMSIASRHAEACTACSEKLADWNEMSRTARTMSTTWTTDMLWPRIERALAREKRRGWTDQWQIAAAIVIFLGLGAVLWMTNHQSKIEQIAIRESAMEKVERIEREHVAAIEDLEKLAEHKLDSPATPLMVNYKEKLMLLDDAIAECQTNIERNRNNAYLRSQLLAMYSDKQRTLQDVLREEPHVSNQ